MKQAFVPAAIAAALVLAGSASAQPAGRSAVTEQVEAIVTVTAVDPKAKTVTFRGPRGQTATANVPNAQNLDQIKPGSRFKVLYTEAAAVSIKKGGGDPGTISETRVQPAAKGANPGGFAVSEKQVTGVVEAVDRKNRYMSVRGPKGGSVSVKVPEELKELDEISAGDRITLTYVQAVAADMMPEPGKPKS